MGYAVVLSDELLKEFYAFKSSANYDKRTIAYLLQHYKNSYLTNVAQLKRAGIDAAPLMQQLASSNFTTQPLEELCQKTKYKLILHESNSNYPYLNIFNDNIESNYTATHYKEDCRAKAREHIKALLQDASHIFIYDKYISKSWPKSKKLFSELVPKKSLSIYYCDGHLASKATELKKMCSSWKIVKDTTNTTHRNLHDRYIIIDSTIEIILTSGIDNLFDERSDFTYIVRTKGEGGE